MHDYTPKQIRHIGDSMVRDRTFVLNMIAGALGGKSKGKSSSSRSGTDVNKMRYRQAHRAAAGVDHFNSAQPGELTPGSRRFDLRKMSQQQAHMQLCAVMGQRPKE